MGLGRDLVQGYLARPQSPEAIGELIDAGALLRT